MSSQPDQAKPTCGFDEVRNQELSLIASRRRAAASPSQSEPAVAQPSHGPQDLSAELTGLALSGGGIRSAAFNLGLLQGLYDKDLLRQVDYLSTVSGGGYAGAHLSSMAMHPDSQFAWQKDSVSPARGIPAVAVPPTPSTEPHGDQPQSEASLGLSACTGRENPVDESLGKGGEGTRAKAVKSIAQNCRYLTQPTHFLNRQLIGAFCLNVVTISGLVTFAALVAWAFRTLDSQSAIRFLDVLKIRSDIGRALLPAILLFGLWLLSWAVAFFRDRENAKGEIAKFFLMSWIAALFLGVAALSGNGDVAVSPAFDAKYGIDFSDSVTWFFRQVGTAGLLAILGGLLPYLNPKALIRSATINRRGVQGLVYRTATKAMLFGVPLLLFWYLASEDIGGTNLSRIDQIFPNDVLRAKAKAEAKMPIASSEPSTKSKSEQLLDLWNLSKRDLEYNTTYDVHVVSITNPVEFWQLVDMSAAKKPTAGKLGADKTEVKKPATGKPTAEKPADSNDVRLLEKNLHRIPQGLAAKLQKAREAAITDSNLSDPQIAFRDYEEVMRLESLWSVGFSCVRYLIGEEGTLFGNQLDRKKEIARGNTAIARQINADLLADAKLYRSLGFSKPAAVNELIDVSLTKEKNARRVSELGQVREFMETAIAYEEVLNNVIAKIEKLLNKKLDLKETADSLGVEQVIEVLSDAKVKLTSDEVGDVRKQIRHLVKLSEQIRKNNRQILEFYCQGHLKPHTIVYATIVQPADQDMRWTIAMFAGVIWLLSSALVSLNAISLQGVYRDALSRAWIVDPTERRGSSMNLHELSQVSGRGCPYHLMTGAMSFGAQFGFNPTGDPFLFSPLYCGSDTTGYVRSARYAFGSLTLPDAMAISGAAVAPLQIDDPLGRILLTLANFRMGTWLPNPLKPCWHIDLAALPMVPQVFLRLWTSYPQTAGRVHLQWILWQWFLPAKQTPFLYLSDGGHYENLGIGELLKRRCRVIIASDAGEDSGYKFEDFIKAVHTGNTRIRIEETNPYRASFSRLKPDATTRLSEQHFVVMKIEYLDDIGADGKCSEGYLIYIKPTLTGDEDTGLRGFQSLNTEFPHDPTANQLFEDDKFEAYRRLGYHIAVQLSKEMSGHQNGSFWLGGWSPSGVPTAQPSGPAPITATATAEDVAPKAEVKATIVVEAEVKVTDNVEAKAKAEDNDKVKTDVGHDDEVERLRKIALDPNQEQFERFFATRFLAADHSKPAAETLRALLRDDDAEVAYCAVKALPLASECSVSLLASALSSQHVRVQAKALRLLNRCGAAELKPHTDELLVGLQVTLRRKNRGKQQTDESEMLENAVKILGELFQSADRMETHNRVCSLLKEVLANPRSQKRIRAAVLEAMT